MRILLAAGANLNPWRSETMSHGFTIDDTPLSLAIAHRQDEAVLMLLDADCALYSPESSSDRRRCKESILSRAMKFLDTSSDEVCARLAADSSTSAVDRCRCACSMGGCTPSIMLIRGSKLSFHRKWALLRSWSRAFEGTSDISNQCWLEVARLETFQQLQLTHVCCGLEQDAHQHKMNSEQDEIQQEESVLIEQLESWMIRFQEEKIKFRGSMATFTDTWLTMMRAELGNPSEHGEWAGDTIT